MTPRPVEESPPLLALRGQVVKGYEEIIRTPATGELRYRSVSASPVRDAMGTLIGSVSVVRDITESKRAEEALVRANRQLSLLGSITRHDVRNQLMALMSYIELARIAVPGMDKASEFLQNAYNAALDIDSHIQFMKEYQDVGSRKPQWFSLSELANQIKIPDGILFSAMVEGIEVYADPLLGKVFYNLFDNSLRHGKRVTAIKVSTQNDNGTLRLIWVDNGIGVPEEEKEKIFIRGFGKNTGLGLFLSREILGLTGLLIRENGLADEGARFEILAPPGSWRIAPATDTTPTVNKTEFNPVPGPCEPERAGLL
jgi:signal transduction histidine kinase